jgi:hypothetical protein
MVVVAWWAAAAAAGPDPIKIPKRSWFNDMNGYEKAIELQKATGANMLVYFFRYDHTDEKGLCRWFETKGLQNGDVEKFLDDYIKVKIQMPLRKKEEETFARFKFNKCPAVFVARAEGLPQKCPVFDWPNNKPELKKGSEIVEIIKARSGPGQAENAPEPAAGTP